MNDIEHGKHQPAREIESARKSFHKSLARFAIMWWFLIDRILWYVCINERTTKGCFCEELWGLLKIARWLSVSLIFPSWWSMPSTKCPKSPKYLQKNDYGSRRKGIFEISLLNPDRIKKSVTKGVLFIYLPSCHESSQISTSFLNWSLFPVREMPAAKLVSDLHETRRPHSMSRSGRDHTQVNRKKCPHSYEDRKSYK